MAEIIGTAGDDRDDSALVGTPEADLIRGLGGSDRLSGGNGNDTLEGGAGDDVLEDGAGDDLVFGGAGNDTIVNTTGNDLYDGGAGRDLMTASVLLGPGIPIDLDLEAGTIGVRGQAELRDTLISIEDFIITSERDTRLGGSAGANALTSDAGNDTLIGNGGDDTLDGGSGDDIYEFETGSPGTGILRDSGGIDTLRIEDTPARDATTFTLESDVLRRETGTEYSTLIELAPDGSVPIETVTWFRRDTEERAGYENPLQLITETSQATSDAVMLVGTGGNDDLVLPNTGNGDAGFVEVYGNAGDDSISLDSSLYSIGYGGPGDDFITGSGNSALLLGDAGNDTLVGRGEDEMTGGGGADAFVLTRLSGTDPNATITDFVRGEDRLAIDDQLLDIGARGITIRELTAEVFRDLRDSGSVGYNSRTGELRLDIDSDGERELVATIEGGARLGLDDVLLF